MLVRITNREKVYVCLSPFDRQLVFEILEHFTIIYSGFRQLFGVRNPLYLEALLALCHFSTEFKQDETGLQVAKVII